MVFQKIIQNDQNSVIFVFVMNSLITRIIRWKTTVNFHNFFHLICRKFCQVALVGVVQQ